ncbi:DNA glycosylase superfamily protein [Artemisia annua]|uniref:DNA glycosylase superfamily protein n=1 Tax=Artemisia annua TaxID=35608 RepID=A0A2U1PTG9_ARTAN|nr:DNA glycosylase superfamily protein [Artemisia annua]
MSKENMRRLNIVEKKNNGSPNSMRNKEKHSSTQSLLSKHLKKVYPVGIHKTSSLLSISSLSLTLSNNSSSGSFTDSSSTLEQTISSALQLIAPTPTPTPSPTPTKREVPLAKTSVQGPVLQPSLDPSHCEDGLRRCNWITKSSDKLYVQFHDECWGVPVYDDNQLFEMLSLCGMLIDYNWTEILKRKNLFREAFAGFEPNIVAKMGENEIMEIASNKEIMLAESRVRSIVENAKCILKIAKAHGSFSGYMWGSVNYKPTINRCKHSRNVPLRTPKAETISKDLLKHGFRLVGPVIVYSFMQAAGMSIDHLVDCFRFNECVNLAERPWRHV